MTRCLLALSILLGLAVDALAAPAGDACSMWKNSAPTQVGYEDFPVSTCENGWQQLGSKRCRCTLKCESNFLVQNTAIVLEQQNDDCELFELELISSGSFTLDPKSSIRASLVNINVTNNNMESNTDNASWAEECGLILRMRSHTNVTQYEH